jgi:tripartite ATP-independent transporter DctM subunit
LVLIAMLALWSIINEKKIDLKRNELGLASAIGGLRDSTGELIGESFSTEKLSIGKALWQARYELPLPVIIIGGIYGGFFTTAESATMVLLYTMLMTFVLYRDIPLNRFGEIVTESMALKGAVLLILLCALGLTNYLVDQEIPNLILDTFRSHITSQWAFLLALNLFLLCVGSIMDVFSAIIVVLPLIIPMANEFQVHPIHLAMIFLTNLEIGFVTPPLGINLFISAQRFKKPITLLYKSIVPFIILQFIALLLITYIPSLSLFAIKK